MTHYSRLYKAVIDVPEGDHGKELTFWQEAIGQALPQLSPAATVHHRHSGVAGRGVPGPNHQRRNMTQPG